MRVLICCSCLLLFASICTAQKVLQIEKFGSAKTEKLPIGTTITYKLYEQESYLTGTIRDINIEQGLLEMSDRYVKVEDIEALRFDRSSAKGLSTGLFWMGIGWSGWALIGTATDDNPDTNYRWSDAIVTATAVAGSWAISRLMRHKVLKMNKRYNLRLLDLPFEQKKYTPVTQN